MRRVLFEWHGIKFYSYLVLLYLGLLIGVIAGTYAAILRGLNPGRVYAAMLLLIPAALVGARLLFLMSNWRFYRREPYFIWRQSEGGASLYGGLVLVFLVSLPVLKLLGLPLGAFWDAGSVTLLTGMIFTKVGCFLNGCCAGRPIKSRLSLYLPDHRGIWRRRLPTQLLEAGWAAVIFLGLAGLWRRLPFDGALFLYTVATYSMGRWMLEPTRETIDRIGSWSLHRLLSAGLVVLAATVFLLKWIWRIPAAAMVQ